MAGEVHLSADSCLEADPLNPELKADPIKGRYPVRVLHGADGGLKVEKFVRDEMGPEGLNGDVVVFGLTERTFALLETAVAALPADATRDDVRAALTTTFKFLVPVDATDTLLKFD